MDLKAAKIVYRQRGGPSVLLVAPGQQNLMASVQHTLPAIWRLAFAKRAKRDYQMHCAERITLEMARIQITHPSRRDGELNAA